jgi:hypothetical protein
MQSKLVFKIQECFKVPSKTKFLLGILATLALAFVAHAQTVYVSGGSNIYVSVNGVLAPNPVFTATGANFESLAIGPDNNVDVDTDGFGNEKYAYFLYACDTAGNRVLRFAFLPNAPTVPVTTGVGLFETAYDGRMPVIVPVCGRSSSAGDFYITNKPGKGLFVFPKIANTAFKTLSAASPAPVMGLNFPSTMTGGALTQKYVGDLYVVDNADNEIFRSPYAAPFATLSPFISSNLNGPVGIATAVTTTLDTGSGIFLPNSDVFVANSNSFHITQQPPVSVFNTETGMPTATCPGLNFPSGNNKQVAEYLASAPVADSTNTVINNTIYLVSSTNTSGKLWSWNTAQAPLNSCTLSQVGPSFATAVSGVAVVPAPVTLNLHVTATSDNPTHTNFNFNSSLYQLTATGCTASVTATPLSQATIKGMIHLAQTDSGDTNASPPYPPATPPFIPPLLDSAVPVPGLGDQGFEIAYVAHWFFSEPFYDPPPASCTSVFADNGFLTGWFGFVDPSNYVNPRTVQCDNSDPRTEPTLDASTTCGGPTTVAVFPLNGQIGGDSGSTRNSVFAEVNENLAGAPADFCGLQQPLSNVPYTGGAISSSSLVGTFSASSTTTVNVKFKLAQPGSNCKKNFITNAVALISVARVCNTAPSGDPICGPNGSPVFNVIDVQPTASSLDLPPEFNSGNQQYSFTLNLPNIFNQAKAGIYSLTITFLSDNTNNQTFLFQLTP